MGELGPAQLALLSSPKESDVSDADLKAFLLKDEGVTSIEYALVASLIAVVCAVSVSLVGTNARDLFTTICNAVAAAVSGSPAC